MHSTLTKLLEATNNWCVNIDKGLLNRVIFIDLKKALTILTMKLLSQNWSNMASTKILSAGLHPTYLLGVNNVVSMAIYPPLVKLFAASLKVL